jgi:ribonuclease H / adenosylcobalamin/alpha-ribazole phosphatase
VGTSPRLRARQTAAPLAAAARVDDDLRELDFGELEGRTYDEIAAGEPALYRAWMETPTRVKFQGGESWAGAEGTRASKPPIGSSAQATPSS